MMLCDTWGKLLIICALAAFVPAGSSGRGHSSRRPQLYPFFPVPLSFLWVRPCSVRRARSALPAPGRRRRSGGEWRRRRVVIAMAPSPPPHMFTMMPRRTPRLGVPGLRRRIGRLSPVPMASPPTTVRVVGRLRALALLASLARRGVATTGRAGEASNRNRLPSSDCCGKAMFHPVKVIEPRLVKTLRLRILRPNT